MGHEFETHHEVDTDATVEQVWQAIATGEGVTSWFMGRTEVAPGEGGEVRTAFGDLTMTSRITRWQPPTRFAHRSPTGDDGRFIAYEFLVEGRDRGSTVVRVVTSGFLPGDDWQDEYDAMTTGLDAFARTLAEYLSHFPDRRATAVTAFGPPVTDWPAAWRHLRRALGLGTRDRVTVGDRVRCVPAGLPLIDGVVYLANPHAVGVRADDALYRFLRGFGGQLIAAHHLFDHTHPDPAHAERAWTAWLTHLDTDPDGRTPS
jgi:uncharacterized protein YndB with AHSA1/START domain